MEFPRDRQSSPAGDRIPGEFRAGHAAGRCDKRSPRYIREHPPFGTSNRSGFSLSPRSLLGGPHQHLFPDIVNSLWGQSAIVVTVIFMSINPSFCEMTLKQTERATEPLGQHSYTVSRKPRATEGRKIHPNTFLNCKNKTTFTLTTLKTLNFQNFVDF